MLLDFANYIGGLGRSVAKTQANFSFSVLMLWSSADFFALSSIIFVLSSPCERILVSWVNADPVLVLYVLYCPTKERRRQSTG